MTLLVRKSLFRLALYKSGLFYFCLDQQAAGPSNSDINLSETATVGSFLLDVQATQPNNTITPSPVHSFVVRVDGTLDSDNFTRYWWMVSDRALCITQAFCHSTTLYVVQRNDSRHIYEYLKYTKLFILLLFITGLEQSLHGC